MIYDEKIKDLFSVGNDYVLAHCVSADFALGAGIAVKFRDMGVKEALKRACPNAVQEWDGHGKCILSFTENRAVANLVTKQRYWQKPTYMTLKEALEDMAESIRNGNIPFRRIAMPLIGCGLDGLQWGTVNGIIKAVFKDMDVEILVCKLR